MSVRTLLSTILPTPSQTALLRACLHDEPRAWHAWRDEHGGARAVLAGARDGVKRLLPLLADAQQRTNINEDQAVLTCLRTAYLREEFRSRTFQAICHRVFTKLNEHGVPFIVLRGAALAETDYTAPALRHCHDCDLLIRPADHDRAAAAIAEAEFSVFRDTRAAGRRHTILTHGTGLPVQLHESLFDVPTCVTPLEDVFDRAGEATICGVSCRVLSPADELVHVLGHAAFTARRETLVWACDAWVILHGGREVDWDAVGRLATAAGVAWPVHLYTRYLAEALDAPVPEDARTAIEAATQLASPTHIEAALFGAACGPRGGVGTMWRNAGDLGTRRRVLRWMLAPCPVHVRWAYTVPDDASIGPRYALRPFHGVLRRFRWYRATLADEPTPLPEFMVGGDEATGRRGDEGPGVRSRPAA